MIGGGSVVTAPNERLRAAREATPSRIAPGEGMSRGELAEAVNRYLWESTQRRYTLDAHTIARYERGVVRWPNAAYRSGLRAVLDAATDADLGFFPSQRKSVALRTSGIGGVDAAGVLEPDGEERLAAVAVDRHRGDHAALDALAAVLAGVRRLEDETSASNVLPSVLHQQKLAHKLAANTPARLRPSVIGFSSELAQYLGWLHIPMGQWEDSRQHLDRAVVLAVQANDPVRLATALSFQAYAALRTGNLHTADALSEAAGRNTDIDPGLRTYITFQRAEVLARQSEREQSVRLLDKADRMVERLPSHDELPSSGYWYTSAFFLGQRAFVLHALGDVQQARAAATACLAEMPPTWRDSEWASRRRALAEA